MAHDHKPVSENENGPSSRRQFMTRTASTVAGAAQVGSTASIAASAVTGVFARVAASS